MIESAYDHIAQELELEKIRPSLEAELDLLVKAHNAVHEYVLLASLFFADEGAQKDWNRKSAFLFAYHSEIFEQAHRSLIEALCAHYNAAFILLRATLELLLKGAFWECLSHKVFREDSQILDADKRGRNLKDRLREHLKQSPNLEGQLELISASIYDVLGSEIEQSDLRVSIETIVRQLDEWGIFDPIPNAVAFIYECAYRRLSADVHVVPDRTDIGRRLDSGTSRAFEREVLPEILREYAKLLHQIMDVAVVVEVNVLRDLVGENGAREQLMKRLPTLECLGLEYGLARMKGLLDVAA